MINAAFTGPASPSAAPARNRKWLWPGLIFALLGAQMIFCITVVYVAVSDLAFAVEPDYYKKAVDWDATAAQARANQALGWTLRTQIAEEAGLRGERNLFCALTDRAGQALTGANVEVVAFHHARGSARFPAQLMEQNPGQYAGALPLRKAGWWEFRFTVRHGEQTFTCTDLREVVAARRGN